MSVGAEWAVAVWGGFAAISLAAAFWLARQKSRDRAERRRMQAIEKEGLHLPASLHPVINTDICISSAACVAACPEGDVLGLIGGAGRLVHGSACIGHGRCAAECPVDAIRLVFGTAERGVDIPYVTPDFETSRAGIYVAGELGGMGLIRNAVRQGVGAARHAAKRLVPNANDRLGVVVVGAGPAGLGAGLACLEAGVSFAVIEQDAVGGTVAHYPRQKLILTEPVEVPLVGRIHRAEMSKEELLALWEEIIAETGLEIHTGQILENIDGGDGDFTVRTSAGTWRCQKVILAIGRRGTPRKLGIPGEQSARVCYRLVDPEQYRGKRVLVVGGGDSALEAAATLAEQTGTRVTLCYRGDSFYRAKAKNRDLVEAAAARGLVIRLGTEPIAIIDGDGNGNGAAVARLRSESGEESFEVDQVVAALGGAAPAALLAKLEIRIDRWFGATPGETAASTRVRIGDRPTTGFGVAAAILLVAGVATAAGLAWLGRDYYPIDALAREQSPWHDLLRPAGVLGHGIGVVATAVMLTNFFYAARKRLPWLRRGGSIRRWLTLHVVVGALTPGVILFHAAFQTKNLVATVSYGAVAAVVLTGAIGRWIYGRVHSGTASVGTVGAFKRLLRVWRMIHVLLALVMVFTIMAHVGVTWLFGYRWIFG